MENGKVINEAPRAHQSIAGMKIKRIGSVVESTMRVEMVKGSLTHTSIHSVELFNDSIFNSSAESWDVVRNEIYFNEQGMVINYLFHKRDEDGK